MIYITESITSYVELKEGDILYDPYEIERSDVVDARYHKLHFYKDNRDIACLPLPLDGKILSEMNMNPVSYYDPEEVEKMKVSARLRALSGFKDEFRAPLSFHRQIEKQISEALISSYKRRKIGFLTTMEDSGEMVVTCQSVGPMIGSSVKNISLIGTAGSGKSTAVELTLSRYPKVIRHTFQDGSSYHQIPIIKTTAYEGSDMKSLFINLAQYIDVVTDNDHFFSKKMMKCATVAKMENYLIRLIQMFHVGLIVIDEIQLAARSKVFSHLLTITAQASVSVCVIGTEEALEMLNENLWGKRRFDHLGAIRTDATEKDNEIYEAIISCMWQYQWTREKYRLTEKVVRALKEVSAYNVDFLTTVFVTAQYILIASEDKNLKFDAELVRKAARKYPKTTEMIVKGKTVPDEELRVEKTGFLIELGAAAETAEEEENRKELVKTTDTFIKKNDSIREVIKHIMKISDYQEETIRKTYEYLYRRNPDFKEYEEKQKANAVFRELIKAEEKAKHEPLKLPPKKKTKKEIIDSMAEALSMDM